MYDVCMVLPVMCCGCSVGVLLMLCTVYTPLLLSIWIHITCMVTVNLIGAILLCTPRAVTHSSM